MTCQHKENFYNLAIYSDIIAEEFFVSLQNISALREKQSQMYTNQKN